MLSMITQLPFLEFETEPRAGKSMMNLMKVIENSWVYRCDLCGWESKSMNDREVLKSSPPLHRCREESLPKKK